MPWRRSRTRSGPPSRPATTPWPQPNPPKPPRPGRRQRRTTHRQRPPRQLPQRPETLAAPTDPVRPTRRPHQPPHVAHRQPKRRPLTTRHLRRQSGTADGRHPQRNYPSRHTDASPEQSSAVAIIQIAQRARGRPPHRARPQNPRTNQPTCQPTRYRPGPSRPKPLSPWSKHHRRGNSLPRTARVRRANSRNAQAPSPGNAVSTRVAASAGHPASAPCNTPAIEPTSGAMA